METLEMKVRESEQLKFLEGKKIESARRVLVTVDASDAHAVYHAIVLELEGEWRVTMIPMSDRKVNVTVMRKGVIEDVKRDENLAAGISEVR